MADGEKPYRVYRGGRTKGKVPLASRPSRTPAREAKADGDGARYTGPGPKTKRRRRWSWKRSLVVGVILLLLLVVVWGIAGYLAFSSGVAAANKRLDNRARAPLTHQNGLLLSHPTQILLIGSDHSRIAARSGDRHADSLLIVRTDPDHHRIAFLSLLRDLWVQIPDHGTAKINAAYQIGGPELTVATIKRLIGLEINHVVVVDFSQFKDLIDRLGGITIDVKQPIYSNSFDCPYSAERCRTWKGWRFAKGKQHMSGERALIYSRIRENRLSPESDATRAERQQQVLQAIAGKLASIGTFFDLPFEGSDLLKPLATDLSPGEFLQLGWVKFRASNGKALHCRLGGQPDTVGGQSVIQLDENARPTIAMFTGLSAPQPPPPGSGAYGSGCVIGDKSLGTR